MFCRFRSRRDSTMHRADNATIEDQAYNRMSIESMIVVVVVVVGDVVDAKCDSDYERNANH